MKKRLFAEWEIGRDFLYRVRCGDTVVALARQFDTTAALLIADNRLTEEVKEGELLYVARYEGVRHRVTPVDTPRSLQKKYAVDYDWILQKNKTPYLYVGMDIIV